jgi:hypothetical protein
MLWEVQEAHDFRAIVHHLIDKESENNLKSRNQVAATYPYPNPNYNRIST